MTIGSKIRLCGLAGSLALSGCLGAADNLAVTEPDESELVEAEESPLPEESPAPEQSAGPMLAAAVATPEEFGGYFYKGVGAFLSAKNNVAELTVYVLPPASSATFKHPKLLLVMPHDQALEAEADDFDEVTLKTGQSRSFHTEAPGTLTQVVASFEHL